MTDYIYESDPFVVKPGEEVIINAVEIKKKNRAKKEMTRGSIMMNGKGAAKCILKIYRVSKSGKKTFIGFTFTDSFGQFIIPISSKKNEYLIRVYSLKEESDNLILHFE
ncbi:MAG: hypothetical protein GX154_12915 [Clostridiales bacterium]|nr:hypothetical protein [Clostridiales bacterium]